MSQSADQPSLKRLARKTHLLPDFLAVARSGGVRPAAEHLHVSQSALTRRIKDLEQGLGVELFERSARGMGLTPFGVALKHHAEMVEMNCNYAVAEVAQLLSGAHGELRMAAGPAWAYGIAPEAVALMKAALPNVHVRVIARMNETMLPMLEAGRLDVVLGAIPDADQQLHELRYDPLIDVAHWVFAGPRHALRLKRKVAIADLASFPWVWFAEAVTSRALLEAQYDAAGLARPLASVTTASMHFGFRVLADNRHLMLLPSTLERPAAADGLQPLRLARPIGSYSAGLIYRPSIGRLEAFRCFRQALQSVISKSDNAAHGVAGVR